MSTPRTAPVATTNTHVSALFPTSQVGGAFLLRPTAATRARVRIEHTKTQWAATLPSRAATDMMAMPAPVQTAPLADEEDESYVKYLQQVAEWADEYERKARTYSKDTLDTIYDSGYFESADY